MEYKTSSKLLAGLFYIGLTVEGVVRQAAWEAGKNELDHEYNFGKSEEAVGWQYEALEEAIERIIEHRKLMELMNVAGPYMRPSFLRETLKLWAEDMLSEDPNEVTALINEHWASNTYLELVEDEDYFANRKQWKPTEVVTVLERLGKITLDIIDNDDLGVNESYIQFMSAWSWNFIRPQRMQDAIRAMGMYPIEPSYDDISEDNFILTAGPLAAVLCFGPGPVVRWLKETEQQALTDRLVLSMNQCTDHGQIKMPIYYTLALRGFPVVLGRDRFRYEAVVSQIVGGVTPNEVSRVNSLVVMVANAILHRFSVEKLPEKLPSPHGIPLYHDYNEVPNPMEHIACLPLVQTICWKKANQWLMAVGNDMGMRREAHLISELNRILLEELDNAGLIE
jgi:hypothetical protein